MSDYCLIKVIGTNLLTALTFLGIGYQYCLSEIKKKQKAKTQKKNEKEKQAIKRRKTKWKQ